MRKSAGSGWRWLAVGEMVMYKDECWDDAAREFFASGAVGADVNHPKTYRRREGR